MIPILSLKTRMFDPTDLQRLFFIVNTIQVDVHLQVNVHLTTIGSS